MRVWAPNGDDVVADVFLFAGNHDAAAFFSRAASVRCHRAATARAAARPPRARNLIWTNPDGPTQQDLFLLRGPLVYRIAAVRSGRGHGHPPSVEREIAVSSIDALACELPDAGCIRTGTSV